MIASSINFELLEHLPPQLVLGKHPFDSQLYQLFRMLVDQFPGLDLLETTRIATVGLIGLVFPLIPRELHLVGIDHDQKIAGIQKVSITRLFLAHENGRDA